MIYKISLYFMAMLYFIAGVLHFVKPEFYLKIMPPYLPWHLALVYISGGIEIILALALIPTQTRMMAAWGIILLLIAVFPANLYHYESGGAGMDVPGWLLLVRLFLQGALIAWAYVYTRNTSP